MVAGYWEKTGRSTQGTFAGWSRGAARLDVSGEPPCGGATTLPPEKDVFEAKEKRCKEEIGFAARRFSP
jgi:hypothetical protein